MKPLVLALALSVAALPAWSNPAATALLNQIGAENGMPQVRYSPTLEKAAQRHLNDMLRSNFRSHTGSSGSTVGQRITRAGYRFCFAAENIAWGQRSLQSVMQGWVNSPGHFRNMVNRNVGDFALVRGAGNVWVMVMAGKRC